MLVRSERELQLGRRGCFVIGIEPQLWVEGASSAVAFYRSAFDAEVLHQVGEGDDIVAQLAVGSARFWVTEASEA